MPINDTDSYSFNLADTTNLSISLPAPETLTLTPSAEGVFGSKSIAVGVSTNSPYGYTLTMSAASSSLSRSAAVGGVTPTIPTLTTASSEEDFPTNYWGFKRNSNQLTDTLYQPMLANSSVPLNVTNVGANSSETTVTFGVKLDNSIPSGTYNLTLNFMAITNPNNPVYMQNINTTDIVALMSNVGDTATLVDSRDDQHYTVGRLADGNIWLLDNLRLGGDSAMTLTSADTNIASGTTFTLPASGTANFDSANGYTNAAINTSLANTDATYRTDYTGEAGKIGVFYNYCAASAGTICAASDSNNDDATYDICPAGWKLPVGNTSKGSYSYLYTNSTEGYNSNQVNFTNALRTPLSGNFSNGQAQSQGSAGLFWSSTRRNGNGMYNLYVGGSNVIPQNNDNRYNGLPVRCIYDMPETMQSFSLTEADAMAEYEEKTLMDVRDGNIYTVKKINGNVWMTQNLRFLGTTLTPADSNVSENITMTYYSLDKNDDSYIGHCDETNGYNYVCIKDSGSTETGVWYNYAAASAGTITGSSNTTPATSSLCPSGWHIPTGPANSTSSEFYELFQSTSANIATNAYLTAFNTVTGGYYNALGSISNPEYGYWWSATANNATYRYFLGYNSSNTQFLGNNGSRYSGFFVRCVHD